MSDLSLLEIVGIAYLIFTVVVIAVMIAAHLVENSKRYQIYHFIMSLSDKELRRLERILNDF